MKIRPTPGNGKQGSSASRSRLEAEVFAGKEFGYNVPADHVLGMELGENKEGKLQAEPKAGCVLPYGPGKVTTIQRVLKDRGDPIFVAGDSDGDYNMLSEFKGAKLALILNRVKGGNIGELCGEADKQKDEAKPRYILQGRDENTGLFIPSRETILLGQSRAQLFK